MVSEGTSQPHEKPDPTTRFIAIDELTEDVLLEFTKQIQSNNIRVDKDLPQLSADVYPKFIHAAVSQLIENAIHQMPTGGELNVTLIEGDRCWELEVADSTTQPGLGKREPFQLDSAMTLPKIVATEERSKLELTRRAATVHGGHVQTWDCPQGGTANVLIIPRRQENSKLA